MSQRYQGGFLTASYNGLKVPNAPSIGTATAGSSSAFVTFTAPSNVGGGAITGYTAIATPGGATNTGASSPITVSGLSNGTAYTFQVLATNAYGSGPLSSASNSVTPVLSYMEYLILAGGGGGSGGGGGAGGILTGTTIFSGSYTVTIGAGGSLATQTTGNATAGSNSLITGLTAIGGGYGAGTTNVGGSGGSGGGASIGTTATAQVVAGGTATSGQGNVGGTSTNTGVYTGWLGAGGGGASAVGQNVADYDTGALGGGLGGAGLLSSITGSPVTYATGGKGYLSTGVSADAAANSGGGGGGSRTFQAASQGWNGGSGIVVIAYPDTYPAISSIGGGLTYDQPSRSGYRVYRFTAGTGTITF